MTEPPPAPPARPPRQHSVADANVGGGTIRISGHCDGPPLYVDCWFMMTTVRIDPAASGCWFRGCAFYDCAIGGDLERVSEGCDVSQGLLVAGARLNDPAP